MNDLPESIDYVDEGWAPRGELEIERALRGLDRMAFRWQSVQRQASEFRADIDAWERQQLGALQGTASRIVLGLQAWAKDRRAASKGKDKRFSFPSGEIWTATVAAKSEITDEPALLAWCKENCPEAVKTTESVLRSVLLKADGVVPDPAATGRVRRVMHKGEVVPGITYLAALDSMVTVDIKLASTRALPSGGTDA